MACGEDVLVLSQVQLEGKKRMETDAFLRGYQIETGRMLQIIRSDVDVRIWIPYGFDVDPTMYC